MNKVSEVQYKSEEMLKQSVNASCLLAYYFVLCRTHLLAQAKWYRYGHLQSCCCLHVLSLGLRSWS